MMPGSMESARRRCRLPLVIAVLAALCACRPAPRRRPAAEHPAAVFGRMHTLALGGDTVLARRMHVGVHDDDASRPLGALRTFFDEADVSHVNLECILSSQGEMADKGERNPFFYRGRPDLVRVLIDGGIDVVTLANNHAGDYGPEAIADGLGILDAAGIQHVGAGRDEAEATAPAFRRVGGVVVAFIGAEATQRTFDVRRGKAGTNYLSEEDPDRFVEVVRGQVARARRHAHLVFLTVHWGPNNVDAPTDARRALARRLIDAGVDAILGHSAHRTQGIEIHRDKPILYDAGNLLWDYDDKGPSHEGLVFRLHFDRTGVRWIEALPVRLRKNRTEPDPGGEAALERFAGLCRDLGTDLLRFPGSRDGPPGNVGYVALWDAPRIDRPQDPDAAPAAPERRTPPREVLFPTPVTVVPSVAPDATLVRPPLAFEGGIELVAWRIDTPRVRKHRPLVLTTWWRTAAAMPQRWEVFIHVDGTVPDQAPFAGGGAGEHEPGDWSHPTNRWQPGQLVMDRFDVRPYPDVPPGAYEVFVGMWQEGSRRRLAIPDASRHDGENRVLVGGFEQTAEE
jgi:poly-gamma-glutamate capsule biosynthesis protein CapA/YwtB (metallophosphatase superfamily)